MTAGVVLVMRERDQTRVGTARLESLGPSAVAKDRIDLPPNASPRVSVIIPVLDDAARLGICLTALDAQSFQHGFEIIVVDNGSSDELEAVTASFSRARLLQEDRRSSYAARNRGAAAARGDILAFTDSDCVPASDWLECGVQRVEEADGAVFVGGPVNTFARDPERPTPAELYESVHAFHQRRYVEALSFSVTANLLVRREMFQEVGDFNGSLKSGGDWEWGQRARRAGLRPLYAEDVRVAHPCRCTIAEITRKNRRRTEGFAQLQALGGAPDRRRLLRRVVRPPVRSTVRNFRKLDPPSTRSKVLYACARLVLHYIGAYHEGRAALGRVRQPGTGEAVAHAGTSPRG